MPHFRTRVTRSPSRSSRYISPSSRRSRSRSRPDSLLWSSHPRSPATARPSIRHSSAKTSHSHTNQYRPIANFIFSVGLLPNPNNPEKLVQLSLVFVVLFGVVVATPIKRARNGAILVRVVAAFLPLPFTTDKGRKVYRPNGSRNARKNNDAPNLLSPPQHSTYPVTFKDFSVGLLHNAATNPEPTLAK